MRGKYLVPSALSMVALTISCGILLLILSHLDLRNSPDIVTLVGQLFVLALLLDGLDGVAARLLHAETDFGCYLDTYMDFTTYAIIPAVLFLLLFGQNLLGYIIFVYIIVMGACRMSKFHTTRVAAGSGEFMGLPITLNALWVVVLGFLLYGHSSLQGFFDSYYMIIYPIAVFSVLILCLLQILNVQYPKPTKNPFIMSLLVLFTVAIFTPFVQIKTYLAVFFLFYIAYFVLRGVFTGTKHHDKKNH